MESPCGLEDGVANGFGIKSAAVHAPEKAVFAVDFRISEIVLRGLAVGGAGDDQAVKLFEGAAVALQFECEPIEEFGVSGNASHATEVVGGIDDADPEMELPETIGDGTPNDGIAMIAKPASESRAATGIIAGLFDLDLSGEVREDIQ